MPDTEISRRGFLRDLFTVAGAAVVVPTVLVDSDYERWVRGEGRIWQVQGPRKPLLGVIGYINEKDFVRMERQRILSDYLSTSEGRQKLAESLVQPLRARLDYASIGRQAFQVEQLPDGALPSPPVEGQNYPQVIADTRRLWRGAAEQLENTIDSLYAET